MSKDEGVTSIACDAAANVTATTCCNDEICIMSWNVASLTTTIDRLKKEDEMSLLDFCNRHCVDILCVQEHKIALDKLKYLKELLPGWESYWSYCTVPKKTGFNGVVTFIRSSVDSTAVVCADNQALQNKSLDEQGRCILTIHKSFCLFNVYIPLGNGENKMDFLHHLHQSMERLRSYYHGTKPIVLVGDLNMVANPKLDRHWSFQTIQVPTTIINTKDETANNHQSEQEEWKEQLVKHWPTIQQILSTKQAVPVKTKNVHTNVSFHKYRVCLQLEQNNNANKKVYVGGYEASEEEALYPYSRMEDNCINITVLAELMKKCVGISWSDVLQKQIALELCSVPSETSLFFQTNWLSDQKMKDTFRLFHTDAKERFTCWCQYTNERNSNRGTRIDYILVDHSVKVNAGGPLRSFESHPNSSHAAWEMATANGKWEGSSLSGDGIGHCYAALQFGTSSQKPFPRHTGIVYTPPSYSDHVPVTALLQLPRPDKKEQKPAYCTQRQTKQTQPHKLQPSISQFFSSTTKTKTSNKVVHHKRKPTNIKSKIAKDSILNHFTAKNK